MVTYDKSRCHRPLCRLSRDVVCRGVIGTFFAALLPLLAACATPPHPSNQEAAQAYEETKDPLEPFNRAMFGVNQTLDGLIIKPLATIYRGVLPEPARTGIRNALDNLRTPVVLANDLLQGEFGRAGTTVTRFGINTTIGIGGLMDPATEWGYAPHNEDFGQTLAVHDVGEGTYLFLPILGPGTARDNLGRIVDLAFDPLTYVSGAASAARFATDGIDLRAANLETLEEIERTSIDYYAAIRSLYRQRRAHEIDNEEIAPDPAPESPGFLGAGVESRRDAVP